MGRPKIFAVKKLIRFSQPLIDEVDAWRKASPDNLDQSEAIRQLIQIGLNAETNK